MGGAHRLRKIEAGVVVCYGSTGLFPKIVFVALKISVCKMDLVFMMGILYERYKGFVLAA